MNLNRVKIDGRFDHLLSFAALGGEKVLPAGLPIEVLPGLVVRPFSLADLRILRELGSFISDGLDAAINCEPIPDEPPASSPGHSEAAYLMMRTTAEARAVVVKGRDYYRATALREIDSLPPEVRGAVLNALFAQIRPVGKVMLHLAERERDRVARSWSGRLAAWLRKRRLARDNSGREN